MNFLLNNLGTIPFNNDNSSPFQSVFQPSVFRPNALLGKKPNGEMIESNLNTYVPQYQTYKDFSI